MLSRLTGRQVTTMVVALCVAVIAFPVGAFAATLTKVRIADSTQSSRVAHVTAQGRISTTTCDADGCAAVDAGRLRVGDGSGALTVDGSVLPYVPSKAFSRVLGDSQLIKPGLASGTIMITSMSFVNLNASPQLAQVVEGNLSDPNCAGPTGAVLFSGLVSPNSTLAVTFPSPIVASRCAYASMVVNGMNVTGYVYP